MPTVSVQRTPSYDPDALYRSVCAHFEAVKLTESLTPETKVLLKPNLLAWRDPALAVTTHPALLYAVAKRLRELAFLNSGVHITLLDERVNREEIFHYHGGIRAFVEHLNRSKTAIHPHVISLAGERGRASVPQATTASAWPTTRPCAKRVIGQWPTYVS